MAKRTDNNSKNERYVVEGGVLSEYLEGEREAVIPEGVVEIGEGAFKDNSSLRKVVLPAGLRKIGDFAFCGCKKLESVVFNDDLVAIG